MITKHLFGTLDGGTDVYTYTMKNKNGMTVRVSEFGGALVEVCVPDRWGRMTDVIGGYDSLRDYVLGDGYQGSLIGRIGNRIAKGKFTLDGKEYTLGKHGFARKSQFKARKVNESHIQMTLESGEHLDSYPFAFLLEVDFELLGKSIKITHRVNNRDSRPMYFSIGAHPAFNCSIGDHVLFTDDRNAWAYKLNDETKLASVKKVEKGVQEFKLMITERT